MNTKKAQFLGKPGKIKKTLHSLSWAGGGSASVFFTLGESEEVTLSVETEMGFAFLFLHTPDEYIAFKDKVIVLKTLKNRFEIPWSQAKTLTMRKEGALLTFLSGGTPLLTTEKEAYRPSASFGIVTEGCSSASLEVF